MNRRIEVSCHRMKTRQLAPITHHNAYGFGARSSTSSQSICRRRERLCLASISAHATCTRCLPALSAASLASGRRPVLLARALPRGLMLLALRLLALASAGLGLCSSSLSTCISLSLSSSRPGSLSSASSRGRRAPYSRAPVRVHLSVAPPARARRSKPARDAARLRPGSAVRSVSVIRPKGAACQRARLVGDAKFCCSRTEADAVARPHNRGATILIPAPAIVCPAPARRPTITVFTESEERERPVCLLKTHGTLVHLRTRLNQNVSN
jgi:hypothetical protein